MAASTSIGRLVGRGHEVARLGDALDLAARGEPQVVVLTGDAGIGKSTLLADLLRRAQERGCATALGHCLDIEADIPFAPVVEAVRPLVSVLDDLDGRPHARRMRTLLDADAPSPEQVRMLEDLRLTVLEAAAA